VFEISAPETLRGEELRLLQQMHEAMHRLHCSRCTEEAYVHWIKHFILCSGRRHPAAPAESEVSTLLLPCKQVLGRDLARMDGVVRATRHEHVPVAFTRNEAALSQVVGAVPPLKRSGSRARSPVAPDGPGGQRRAACARGCRRYRQNRAHSVRVLWPGCFQLVEERRMEVDAARFTGH